MNFLRFSKNHTLFKILFCYGVPRSFQTFKNMPLICIKVPRNKSNLAIGSLGYGGGQPEFRRTGGGVGRGRALERQGAHLRPICGRRRGGNDVDEQARRCRVVAVAGAATPAKWRRGLGDKWHGKVEWGRAE
jgi:hypothetical protein